MTAVHEIAVELEGVSFAYAGSERQALHDVSLCLHRGELAVVMGHTGAGKSTLAKCINRTVPAFQAGTLTGRITVLGRRLDGASVADLAGKVGLVLQDFEAQLFATDVVQEIAFGLEQLGIAPAAMHRRVVEALAIVGLSGFERRDPATLSGGEKQRLAIAAVLAMRPPVLVFDEPTTDLDPAGKQDVFRALAAMRREGYTLLLIEHEIDAAAVADKVFVMSQGQIVAQGRAAEVLRQVDLLQKHGIRPRDVDRLAIALSLPESTATGDDVERELRRRHQAPAPLPAASPRRDHPSVVEVRAATFCYAGREPAVRNVSLDISRGEFVALIGQNGSGKTTLAKLLNGLLHAQAGTVEIGGTDITRLPLARVAGQIGYVFQDPDQQLFAPTVRQEVSFGPSNLGVVEPELTARVRQSIEAVGLVGLEEEDPFLLGKGQRQRLAVAAMLAQRPRLLILDEPTTGLDYTEQVRMMELVAQLHRQDIAIVVITHSPWVVAEYAERGILMGAGEILFDGPLRELFRREDILEQSHFRVPEVTRLGNRFGATALSVDEFVAAVHRAEAGAQAP